MPLWTWAARAAICLHPPAWKRRYGREVLALIEDAPPGARGALGLMGSAMREWPVAVWRGVVMAPDGDLRPGPFAGLSAVSFVAGLTAMAVAWWIRLFVWFAYALWLGYPDIALRIVDVQSPGFVEDTVLGYPPWLAAAALVEAVVLFGCVAILPTLPVIVICRRSGLGERLPLSSRLVVACWFSVFPVAVWSPLHVVGFFVSGWVLASGLFPRIAARHWSPA